MSVAPREERETVRATPLPDVGHAVQRARPPVCAALSRARSDVQGRLGPPDGLRRLSARAGPRENSKTQPTRASSRATPMPKTHQPTARPRNEIAAATAIASGHQLQGRTRPARRRPARSRRRGRPRARVHPPRPAGRSTQPIMPTRPPTAAARRCRPAPSRSRSRRRPPRGGRRARGEEQLVSIFIGASSVVVGASASVRGRSRRR